jgi:Rad3-related DNA helicase
MTEQLVQIEVPQKNLNACWSQNIRDHFPFSEIRAAQEMGAQAIEQAYRENKKFIIIEGPTGSGKSGIGMMAASYAKTQPAPAAFESGAYVLSPQKSLTAQYMSDFAPMGLVELRGRSNYTCTQFVDEDNKPVDCEIGGMLCSQSPDEEEGSGCSFCPYKEAKAAFVRSPLGVTNFAYYLNETHHAGQLLPRKMLVCDEGHNIEAQILSLADIVVNRFRCDEVGVEFLSMPVIKPGQTDKGAAWLQDTFSVAANAVIMKWESDLRDFKEDGNTGAAAKLGKKLNGLKRFMGMINTFLTSVVESSNDWIVYTDETKGSESFGCMIIKPLTATLFADDILFSKASKVVIMSATIGDFAFFMRNLGIDPSDAVTCRIPCDFPVENRPVFIKPIANMSSTKVGCPDCSSEEDKGMVNRKGTGCPRCYHSGQVPSIDVAMPKVAAFLNQILNKYAAKKGIVHCHSYKVNRFMSENLSDGTRDRVITHTSIKGDRDGAIQRHIESEEPTVLFSPSMTEGLDLKDDLSRFSVIVKVPFPYLDPYVKARMQRDSEWYASRVALALVQATGRSNRHKEDKAHHYILDTAIESFLARYHHLFPKWWMDAVVWPN